MVKKTNIAAIYRLSPLQEGILYHTLQAPDSDVYLEQFSCRLEELGDPTRWRNAWQDCISRHPILRTLFTWEKRDQPLQIVRHEVELPWEEIDFRHLSTQAQAEKFEQLRIRDRRLSFDLAKAPLLRFQLLRTGETSYYFLWTFHHILLDGWSQRLLLTEALSHYRTDEPQTLSPAPGYERFITFLDQRDKAGETEFWTEQLSSYRKPCLLGKPARVGTNTNKDSASSTQTLSLDDQLTDRLGRTVAGYQVTLNTLLVAAWALVLASRTASNDIVFGTTVSGRPTSLAGIGETAGLCINTLPVRLRIPMHGELSDWLKNVQNNQLQCRQFENASLADIQKCSGVDPGQVLFDNILVFENLPGSVGGSGSTEVPKIIEPRFDEFSHYPLAILIEPGTEIKLTAVHRRHQISGTTASGLLAQLVHVLGELVYTPGPDLAAINPLPPLERLMLEVEWNTSSKSDSSAQCIHHLVEDTARNCPDMCAIVDGDARLSFTQLNASANRLAWHLMNRGLQPGAKVVIFMERGADAIISFLAVLKAGGVYIPIDAQTPSARIAAIIEDMKHHEPLILSQASLADNLPRGSGAALCPDLEQSAIAARPQHNPDIEVLADQLAYIIYTSGSTGTPKGVMIEHRALVTSTRARLKYYPEQPGTFLLVSSLAVDSSVAGIYWCLCRGATLLIAGHRLEQDLDAMGQLIEGEQATHILCIPSLYQLLLDNDRCDRLRSLKTVIVAGEACPPGLIIRHREALQATALYNEYGPSECTVWATVTDLSSWNPGQPVPIGRPINGIIAYILDSRQKSVPRGVSGELYLGGDALARGYLDDPERTGKSFLNLEDLQRPGTFRDKRLYRTGDKVRYRPDRQIEFLGRIDNQIKVRGHRVEPEEIEQVLCRHHDVLEAAVFLQSLEIPESDSCARPTGTTNRLSACVTLSPTSTTSAYELRDYARQQLPAYMLPHVIRPVLDLPRDTGGKIARRLLAAFQWQDITEAIPVANNSPGQRECSESEQILLDIWREVLDVEEVGLDSNFFELGGDSLLSIRVLSRARKAGLDIASDDFFDQPTVAAQAALTNNAQQQVPEASSSTGELVLSPIQGWFFRHIGSHQNQWGQSLLLRITAPFARNALERAVDQLLQRHEALRMVFEAVEGNLQPSILERLPELPLQYIDLSEVNEEQLASALEREATTIGRSFDLQRGPLIKFLHVMTSSAQDDRLLLCAHHLIIDAESWRILVQDLSALWSAFDANREPELQVQGSSYSSWLSRLHAYANSEKIAEQLQYWDSVITTQSSPIPLDRPQATANNTNKTRELVHVTLPRVETRQLLQDLPQKFNCDLADALLTGLLHCLLDWSKRDHLHVDVEGHGRGMLLSGSDISQCVGWLTTVHPVILRQLSNEELTDTLLRVKESLRGAPNRGLGFGVLRYLRGDVQTRPLPGSGPALICFNYLGRTDRLELAEGALKVESENIGELRAPEGPRAYILEINCWVHDDEIKINFDYSSALHERTTIARLADNFSTEMSKLASMQNQTDNTVYSPSDFPLADLEQGDLNHIAQLLGDEGES